MPRKAVTVEDRTFLVDRDDSGKPLRVYERKLFHVGTPLECWGNVGRWVASSHARPKRGVIARVLEATA